MAQETLKITLSTALSKALGLGGLSDQQLDYFELLAVSRDTVDTDAIDQTLKQRTRILRQWQNSPEFGQEVVKLLPILHRAAKILMDPGRRDAYRKQLEMEEKGETADSTERFRELARVALVGNEITAQDKQQLQQFAREHGMDSVQVRRVIEEVRGEYQVSRQAEAPAAAPAAEGGWEFRIAGQGADAFLTMLAGMKSSGSHLGISTTKLIEDAMNYGLDLPTAQHLVKEQQSEWFKDIARLIAGNGAITEAQMRLLLPKAPDFGLTEQDAYAVLSEYSLSAVASDELRHQFELAEEAFTLEDIEEIIHDSVTAKRRDGLLKRFRTELTRTTRTVPLSVRVGIGAAAFLVLAGIGFLVVNRAGSVKSTYESKAGQSGDTPVASTTPAVATPIPTPAPTIPPIEPDPQPGLNGQRPAMLRLEPLKPGDPPAFEIHISEVTCDQYSQYLKSVLETPPPTRIGGNYPSGQGAFPVTNITMKDVKGFCMWIAEQNGWPKASVRPPSIKEFERATRGMTIRGHGNAQAPDYWDVAWFWRKPAAVAVMSNMWDRVITGKGQTYDMIGNVAEWGDDQQNGQQVVLGGAFTDKSRDFNAMQPRWMPPDTRQPWIGFRYVHAINP